MVYGGLVVAVVVCAFLAMRAKRLLSSALWLAGCSAFVSILFYLMGAAELAVIELSVGAGLVTVLFVLAISVAGEDPVELKSIIRRPIAGALVLIPIGLLAVMIIPSLEIARATGEPAFAEVMWQQRGLDALVQSGLIFAAVVGLLGLLADAKAKVPARAKQPLQTPQAQAGHSVAAPEVKA
ncbi:MAG: NADH-quinone oxidoreductase subunit J [Chloroflexi bacterium]|nr:NADH-quinone oxidoreductase subunit J [Chloroflexota bacterium]